MSTMPGNPHAAGARDAYKKAANRRAQIEAALALAFEQRTANLIQVAVAQDRRGMVGDRYWNEVADRLGTGETDEGERPDRPL